MKTATAQAPEQIHHPFFARVWSLMSAHETEDLKALRRENLAGLSGRVLEVGAGTGANFRLYPDTVERVVAVEPEESLLGQARLAAAGSRIQVSIAGHTIETLSETAPFDAVVCSMVLCTVDDADSVVRQLYSRLKPGGELRYMEHVASAGWRGGVQRAADATVWPRLAGGCHTHRDTERTIRNAGFVVDTTRRQWTLPRWLPLPFSEFAMGRAHRPA